MQCNCLYKKLQKVPQNNFDLALQQENCTDFCKQQYQVKISLILLLPFLLRDHKSEKKKKRKKKEKLRQGPAVQCITVPHHWANYDEYSPCRHVDVEMYRLCSPTSWWSWWGMARCRWAAPPNVCRHQAPHTQRETLTYMRTHTLTFNRILHTIRCTQTAMCQTQTQSNRQRHRGT